MIFENEFNIAKGLVNKNLNFDNNYFRECIAISRYLLTIGKSKEEIKDNIIEKTKEIYKNFSEDYIKKDIENILNLAMIKGELKKPITICFSKKELNEIHSLKNINAEKIMFIMMCLYKTSKDGIFTFQIKDMLKEAKISYNSKYYNSLMYKIIGIKKYFTHILFKNNLRYKPSDYILSLYDPKDIVLKIDDYKNIVYYYLEYYNNNKYMRCENCGCIDIKSSNSKRKCKECFEIDKKKYHHEYYIKNRLNK